MKNKTPFYLYSSEAFSGNEDKGANILTNDAHCSYSSGNSKGLGRFEAGIVDETK